MTVPTWRRANRTERDERRKQENERKKREREREKGKGKQNQPISDGKANMVKEEEEQESPDMTTTTSSPNERFSAFVFGVHRAPVGRETFFFNKGVKVTTKTKRCFWI